MFMSLQALTWALKKNPRDFYFGIHMKCPGWISDVILQELSEV